MKLKTLFLTLLSCAAIISCKQEIDCNYTPIQLAFIGYSPSDLDTIVLRKFSPNNNFQNLMDSFRVDSRYSPYNSSNDTIKVLVNDSTNDGKAGILHGYDWQIFIPSTNQTMTISDIVSEQTSTKCGGLDKTNCSCTNQNISANYNGQSVSFSNSISDSGHCYIYIHK